MERRAAKQITLDQHKQINTPFFSKEIFGIELAKRIAELLDMGHQIKNEHSYYCGTGLTKAGDGYLYADVEDGQFVKTLKKFNDKNSFIDWLSKQSDDSMSGKEQNNAWYTGNQKITKSLLDYELSKMNI